VSLILQARPVVSQFHILIVDDDELAILNLQQALQHAGHTATLTAASNGIHALQLLRSGLLPGERLLVLTDLNMPGMSGIELLTEIRADPALSDLPVVILTASTMDADRAAAFRLHSAGYFLKSGLGPQFQELVDFLHGYWANSAFRPAGAVT